MAQNIIIQFETSGGNVTVVSECWIAPETVTRIKTAIQNQANTDVLATQVMAPSSWGGGVVEEDDRRQALHIYYNEGRVEALKFLRTKYGFGLHEAAAIFDHIRYLQGVRNANRKEV